LRMTETPILPGSLSRRERRIGGGRYGGCFVARRGAKVRRWEGGKVGTTVRFFRSHFPAFPPLLHFNNRSFRFKLRLHLRGLVLRHAGLHGLRRAVNEILRFLEAEARQ